MAGVHIQNLHKSFGTTEVIKGVDLDIKDHEFTVFVGPSGCGKSTLLRLIAGLEDITAGTLKIGDRVVNDIAPAKRQIAMVFQSYALYPHMTVFQNIAFGMRHIKGKDVIRARVQETAEMLKIEHLLERKPKSLSGGQRQRVAIGRALVRDPEVFLFDEPLSNLDAGLRVEMRMQIARLKTKLNKTMIYVTHDQVEAMTLADKIVVLQGGKIEQVGAPLELYNHPRNMFVAGFLGSPRMNFIDITLLEASATSIKTHLPGNKVLTFPFPVDEKNHTIQPNQPLTLGVRPEHCVECAPEEALFSGKVRLVEHLGSEIYAFIRIESGDSVLVRTAGDHPVKIGDIMHVTFDTKLAHLFHPDTELSLNYAH